MQGVQTPLPPIDPRMVIVEFQRFIKAGHTLMTGISVPRLLNFVVVYYQNSLKNMIANYKRIVNKILQEFLNCLQQSIGVYGIL